MDCAEEEGDESSIRMGWRLAGVLWEFGFGFRSCVYEIETKARGSGVYY
jgi:hypothetical protein